MPTYNNETFYPIRYNGIGFRDSASLEAYKANPNAWVSSFSDPSTAFETVQLGQQYPYHDPKHVTFEDVEIIDFTLNEELYPYQIPDLIPMPYYPKRINQHNDKWYSFLQKDYQYPQWEDVYIREVDEIVNPIFKFWR
jgi:hypothetical protein